MFTVHSVSQSVYLRLNVRSPRDHPFPYICISKTVYTRFSAKFATLYCTVTACFTCSYLLFILCTERERKHDNFVTFVAFYCIFLYLVDMYYGHIYNMFHQVRKCVHCFIYWRQQDQYDTGSD
jgi:hypothetical protein